MPWHKVVPGGWPCVLVSFPNGIWCSSEPSRHRIPRRLQVKKKLEQQQRIDKSRYKKMFDQKKAEDSVLDEFQKVRGPWRLGLGFPPSIAL